MVNYFKDCGDCFFDPHYYQKERMFKDKMFCIKMDPTVDKEVEFTSLAQKLHDERKKDDENPDYENIDL